MTPEIREDKAIAVALKQLRIRCAACSAIVEVTEPLGRVLWKTQERVAAVLVETAERSLSSLIRKALKAMDDILSRHGFSLVRSGFDVIGDDALFMFELEVFELPIVKKHMGPPTWVKNSAEFLAKWVGSKDAMGMPYIEEGQWVVDIKRAHITAAQLITAKQDEMSLGKDLEKKAKGTLKVFIDPQNLEASHIAPVYAFMDRRFPWER